MTLPSATSRRPNLSPDREDIEKPSTIAIHVPATGLSIPANSGTFNAVAIGDGARFRAVDRQQDIVSEQRIRRGAGDDVGYGNGHRRGVLADDVVGFEALSGFRFVARRVTVPRVDTMPARNKKSPGVELIRVRLRATSSPGMSDRGEARCVVDSSRASVYRTVRAIVVLVLNHIILLSSHLMNAPRISATLHSTKRSPT